MKQINTIYTFDKTSFKPENMKIFENDDCVVELHASSHTFSNRDFNNCTLDMSKNQAINDVQESIYEDGYSVMCDLPDSLILIGSSYNYNRGTIAHVRYYKIKKNA